jgi:CubicO group peptidase (beta-lactamase class C family)
MRPLLALILAFCTACQGTAPPAALPAPPAAVPFAWVRFDARGIEASGASGLADAAQGRALTVHDPVRIASVSKLLVAMGVMRLVEQGRLDLDRDVSDWLGWRLRNPAFPDSPITLRLLLSHRSSLRDEADYVIPLGKEVRGTVAHPEAFDREHRPGTFFRYSNLNFPVIASVMEKAAGERFDRLMMRLVLEPLELGACFNWSGCSDAAIGRAVVLYAPDGAVVRDDLKGRRPDCLVYNPEGGSCDLSGYRLGTNGGLFSPQGGLRISAHDLAKVGQLLLRGGRTGSGRFLSEASIAAILRPRWRFDGTNGATEEGFYCGYGLATQVLPVSAAGCRDDLLGDGTALVGHAGEAYGVRSGLWIDAARGEGIAYFATANGDDPKPGRSSFRAIEEWLAAHLRR